MKRLFVALALAVTAASYAEDATVSLSSTVNLDYSIFAYKDTTPGSSTQDAALLGSIPAGTYSATVPLNGDLSQFSSYRYTLLATYVSGNDSPTGVVVGLNPDATAMALGTSFEDVFGVDESSIVDAIQGVYSSDFLTAYFSQLTLLDFANNNLSKFPLGVSGGSLVGFSNGVAVGSFNAVPGAVPEPTSMVVLAGGAAALLRRRRR